MTFQCIFSEPIVSDKPWDNFVQWLRGGSERYRINEKAGSGKSTLEKYISSHHETRGALTSWAGDQELITASFFFWNTGTTLQKSQMGLLRSLL